MSGKKNVMIRIDADLAEKAKNLGLNISKVTENALIRSINALEGAFSEINPNSKSNTSRSFTDEGDGGPSRIRTGDYRDVNAVS